MHSQNTYTNVLQNIIVHSIRVLLDKNTNSSDFQSDNASNIKSRNII